MSQTHQAVRREWPSLFMLVATLLCVGCPEEIQMRRENSLKEASSGVLGCAPFEIKILESKEDWNLEKTAETWMAACQGRLYHCSRPLGDAATTSCTERGRRQEPASPAKAPSASPVAGCQYDMQCKGNRICQGGRCVDPSPEKDQAPAKSNTSSKSQPSDEDF
jgi:hypothetical protein